jgi:hypothetical protein
MWKWRVSGGCVVVLGTATLVVGLWLTNAWLSGDFVPTGRGHPLFVVTTGGLFVWLGVGLFTHPTREGARLTRGDELMGRARRAHAKAHQDAARRARRRARSARWPFRWFVRD